MFIHDIPRRLFQQSRLYLHPTLRSPIGITPGTKLNASVRARNSWGVPELIITPYCYEIWPDIWSLELQLIDGPGRLERLFNIFEQCSISVLHYVARTAYKTRYHSNYLMLDCSAYDNSAIDKRPALRHVQPNSRLWGLYYNILIEFMHEVRIKYDNTPKLILSRNVAHLNMWQDTSHKIHDGVTNVLDMPVPVTYNYRGILLSQDLLEKLGIDSNSYCVTSVNTKTHVIQCSILNSNNAHIVHFAIYFDKDGIPASLITKRLYDLNLNIVRSQLAQGIIGTPANMPASLRASPRIATLNVMAISPVPVRREELASKLNADGISGASHNALYVDLVSPVHNRLKVWNAWQKK